MTPLTGLDASFLYLETPEMPMHVGSFNLCELPPDFRGSFHQAVQQHIASRLHLAPVFSRKLVPMPLNLGHPAWVELDADAVDIGFHVRRADPSPQGTAPMTLAEAHRHCAQWHSELLDRRFPLWEFYVFDRIALPDGRIVAGFLTKIHHAALDGKAAVLLASATLDTSPVPREVPPAPGPRSQAGHSQAPSAGRLLGAVLSSSLKQLGSMARTLPSAVRTLGDTLLQQAANNTAAQAGFRLPMKLAPHTPFNIGLGTQRVFATATLPLQACKALGKVAGASLNDLVLWLCATALRDYLSQHHSLPRKSLIAAMPVSLRAEDPAGAGAGTHAGNQVGMSLVELGTHLADPLKRLKAIMASTAKVKTSMHSLRELLPTDYPSLLAPWLVGGLARQAFNAYGKSGLASRLPRVANLAISNVPGPQIPLYLASARIVSFHPLSIIVHGVALNITVQSYDGQVDFGIVADRQALEYADALVTAIEAAFAKAQQLWSLPPTAQPDSTGPEISEGLDKPEKSAGIRKAAARQPTKSGRAASSDSSKPRTRPNTEKPAPPEKASISTDSSHGTKLSPSPAASALKRGRKPRSP